MQMLAPMAAIAWVMPATLVRTELVHHDDIARNERRREELLDIGAKRLADHRSIEHERGSKAADAQTGYC
jgi:hypothetical protein